MAVAEGVGGLQGSHTPNLRPPAPELEVLLREVYKALSYKAFHDLPFFNSIHLRSLRVDKYQRNLCISAAAAEPAVRGPIRVDPNPSLLVDAQVPSTSQ